MSQRLSFSPAFSLHHPPPGPPRGRSGRDGYISRRTGSVVVHVAPNTGMYRLPVCCALRSLAIDYAGELTGRLTVPVVNDRDRPAMDTQRLERPPKSEFAKLCRQLRLEHGLKQREVAAVAGVAATTYGNVESSAYKVISRPRAERIASHYKLPSAQREEFLDAWERCPLSEYGERRRAMWGRRNALRAK